MRCLSISVAKGTINAKFEAVHAFRANMVFVRKAQRKVHLVLSLFNIRLRLIVANLPDSQIKLSNENFRSATSGSIWLRNKVAKINNLFQTGGLV